MSLSPGTRVGPFEIVGSLGAGGMGEVYRARDMRLKRDVALKVLPEPRAADADRVARFQREAELLATLTHQHIAAIYGVEEEAGTRALIIELVEGATIADRLADGPIPVDDTVAIARQLAEALDYAHEHGVLHRDLKPANIKVTPEGQVKVLDFGLAKALDTAAGSRHPPSPGFGATGPGDERANSPTITSPAFTQAGIILGTAAYMSPEQARGKPVDKRADIWAYGCVVYEMLTGTRAFEGETVSDTLASVLAREPDWSRLPAATPPALQRLLRLCLTRDAKERLRDIGDARRVFDESLTPSLSPVLSSRRSALPWIVLTGGLGLALVSTMVLWAPWRGSPPTPIQRHTVELGADASLATDIGTAAVLSPDGQTLVFAATPTGGKTAQLYVRRLDQLQATALTGTDDARGPFFSPDGQWVGFFAGGKLKKVSVNGGTPRTLCDAPVGRGGTWLQSGSIIFLPVIGGGARLLRVSAAGGKPEEFMEPDVGSQRWPQVLPGETALLYTRASPSEGMEIKVQSLTTGDRKSLGVGGYARYLPSGHLLYLQDGTLFAVRLDTTELRTLGVPVPMIEGIANEAFNGAQFAVSASGTLVYVAGGTVRFGGSIDWLDQTGKSVPLRPVQSAWSDPVFDSRGSRLAFTEGSSDIWVQDVDRGVTTRLTTGGTLNITPAWTPDDQRITFASLRDGPASNIFWQRIDGVGGAQRLTTSQLTQQWPAWHPSGRTLAYVQLMSAEPANIMILPLDGDEKSGWKPGTPAPFFESPYTESHPSFSPDGRWLAYSANDTGTMEIYVRPFPGPGGATLVSAGGGLAPQWSHTSAELFYRGLPSGTLSAQILVVPYSVKGDSFQPGKPRLWTERAVQVRTREQIFALHPDGKRVAAAPAPVVSVPGAKQDKLTFVFNFFEELRAKLPLK